MHADARKNESRRVRWTQLVVSNSERHRQYTEDTRAAGVSNRHRTLAGAGEALRGLGGALPLAIASMASGLSGLSGGGLETIVSFNDRGADEVQRQETLAAAVGGAQESNAGPADGDGSMPGKPAITTRTARGSCGRVGWWFCSSPALPRPVLRQSTPPQLTTHTRNHHASAQTIYLRGHGACFLRE